MGVAGVWVGPLALATWTGSTGAGAMGAGSPIEEPFASRHVPGAYQRRPSAPRTKTQGENVAPEGGSTHRPANHAHLPRRHVHSPSTQIARGYGGSELASTRPGGGGAVTSTSALAGWGE